MKITFTILSLMSVVVVGSACNLGINNGNNQSQNNNVHRHETEDDHPYEDKGKPFAPPPPADAVAGLPNLGNTCFANASINLMLSSKEIIDILSSPLAKIKDEPDAEYVLREKLRTTLKALHEARKDNTKDVTDEVNAYFDAFEKARKQINGNELVGGEDKLRKDQGDARDFIEDNLTLLNYAPMRKDDVAFQKIVFKDDKKTKTIELPEKVIGFRVEGLKEDEQYSLKDLLAIWLEPEFMTGENQFKRGKKDFVDIDRSHLFREPAHQSLFLAALRFITSPPKKLSTSITHSDVIAVKSYKTTDLKTAYDHNYNIKAVVIHLGALGGGHYYAYVKNSEKNRWEKYNDSEVKVVDEDTVRKDAKDSYIFLYELQK